jgi:hypothetical protein
MKIKINKTMILEEASLASRRKLKFEDTPCNSIQNVNGKQLRFDCKEVTRYGNGTGQFFISTHRARSKFYPDITKVPISVRKFIDSTG